MRVTVAAVLVLVCSGAAADRLLVPRDYGVKLCGREFIRAVIFTCGGSRWKRSLDLDHLGEFFSATFSASSLIHLCVQTL